MRKTMILSLAAAVLATAPAAAQNRGETGFSPDQTEFIGWVRFGNGEFQLYADQVQVLQPFSRPCVSGAASRDLMRQAVRDLGGQKVRITGQTAPWPADPPGHHRIAHAGSDIRNDCGGTFVVLADQIRPAN
jgi:hypothetical protein